MAVRGFMFKSGGDRASSWQVVAKVAVAVSIRVVWTTGCAHEKVIEDLLSLFHCGITKNRRGIAQCFPLLCEVHKLCWSTGEDEPFSDLVSH